MAFFRTSVGKKLLMAVTGFLLYGFVVVHLIGNLQIFTGQESLNHYAHFLKSKPLVLWAFRLGLLAIVVLHIKTAIGLSLENKRARGNDPYDNPSNNGSSFASRSMALSGLVILAFIIFHLLHFTGGVIFPDHYAMKDSEGLHDVFGMVVEGFSIWWVSAFYIISMVLLCLHLSHGLSALFQSVGLRNSKYKPLIDKFALVSWVVIFVGNIAIPISILLGFVDLPK